MPTDVFTLIVAAIAAGLSLITLMTTLSGKLLSRFEHEEFKNSTKHWQSDMGARVKRLEDRVMNSD